MTRSTVKTSTIVLLTAVVVLACGNPASNDSVTTPTTTALPFPYPPLKFYTEIAVPLEDLLHSAAEFALTMEVDDLRLLDPRVADSIRPTFLSKAAPEAYEYFEPFQSPDFVNDTGGHTLRVVGAQDQVDRVVEVSICIYNSPGQYTLYKDGHIGGPMDTAHPYGLRRTRVHWTDRPAADGSVAAGPRWLWVNNGVDLKMTRETEASVCEPFKPDPFVQKMPDPITPTPTPTR
ncbi:hypothetical protein OG563_18185 [Nocardia vinacea]|uniref:Lipoprotein n=1 Tax=Nocardia vinacea TaxID=96468 RepID=A0ABZ1Z350_9NOCA|nr:hypothetical protein [Nocardia vinacea]